MKKFFWFVVAVLVLVFLVSFISSSVLFFKGDQSTDWTAANIGVIEVEGVITESLPFLEQLRDFKENKQLKALIVRLNTPGGAVGASQEIYMELKKLRENTPVVVSMGNIAASGGLYVSIGASEVVALPGTITGSMGVLMPLTNLSRLLEKIYVEPITIKSGKLKDAGNPFRPMNPEAKAYLQDMVDQSFKQFREDVASERKLKPEVVERLSDGRVVNGSVAVEMGLADSLGTFEDAVEIAKKRAEIEGEARLAYLSREDEGWIFKVLRSSAEAVADKLLLQTQSPLYLFDIERVLGGSKY